jgi:hypothetical protein
VTVSRLASGIVYLLLAFLLYKYVILQIGLINPNSWYIWAVILILLVLSFAIGGFEASVIMSGDSEMSQLLHEMSLQKSRIEQSLSEDHFRNTGIRPIARLRYYIIRELPLYPFTLKLAGGNRRTFSIERCLVLMSTMSVIIDVNVTVLFSMALISSKSFATNILSLPFMNSPTLNDLLPMPGSDGFTSVGVSLVMLILIETTPKKIAARYPQKFFKFGKLIIASVCILSLGTIVIISSRLEHMVDRFIRDPGRT